MADRWIATRAAARSEAAARGLFWLPCPLCGVEFGGHEWEHDATIPASASQNRAICPPCAEELRDVFRPVCDDHGHTYETATVVTYPEAEKITSCVWCGHCR